MIIRPTFNQIIVTSIVVFASFLTASAQSIIPAKGDKGLWGYKTASVATEGGEWVVRPQYDKATDFADGLAAVSLSGKYGFIDREGNMIIPLKYSDAKSFSEGFAAVKLYGKWGYIKKDGSAATNFLYDDAYEFSEGLAAVRILRKWGYINATGENVIPFKCDFANTFSEGLAAVRINNDYGFIDKHGKFYINKDDYRPSFSEYAQRYVEVRVNEWQKKNKYEKNEAWKARVNDNSRAQYVKDLSVEAERRYIEEFGKKVRVSQRLGDYDADNEVFLVNDLNFGQLLVPVPISKAEDFENSFGKMNRRMKYFIEADTLALAEVAFLSNWGEQYLYSNQASLDYFIDNIDYNFEPIEISAPDIERNQRGKQNIRRNNLSVGKSDIDLTIPISGKSVDNTFAVIISNEQYRNEDPVPFARNDGEVFRKYCSQTLGIPDERIHFRADATLNEMRLEFNWLKNIGETFGSDARIIVYYSGHGMPDEKSGSAYLLPVDGSADDAESGYSIARMYDQLGELPVESVIVFMDACFSGSKREGGMLYAQRGVTIRPKDNGPQKGRLVVFSASMGDETALMYDQMGHGLFTYFLLKRIQETKGNVTFGDLADFVSKKVGQESTVIHNKRQSPTVLFSPEMSSSWKQQKLLK